MIHLLMHGHRKTRGVIGYDGMTDVYGCLVCEFARIEDDDDRTQLLIRINKQRGIIK